MNNRDVIPLPFGLPDGDITIFISDWYTKSHKVSRIFDLLVSCSLDNFFLISGVLTNAMGKQKLRKDVENEIDPGVPDGVVMNGFGPYRYDEALVADGITFQIINVEPGKQGTRNILVCGCFYLWNISWLEESNYIYKPTFLQLYLEFSNA